MGQRARIQQQEQKRVELALEAHRNKSEYDSILQEARRVAVREESQLARSKAERLTHRNGILKQIADKEIINSQGSKIKKREGEELKQEFATELAKLENARKQIVNEFTQQGCQPAYLAEMKKADMRKFQ